MKTPLKPGIWVSVVWNDAADEKQTWLKESEIDEELVTVTSVGYLVRKTGKYFTIAGDVHESGGEKVYGRVSRIPTAMAVSMTEVKT